MSLRDDPFIKDTLNEIKEEIQSKSVKVLSGAMTHDLYRSETGYIKGLTRCIEIIEGLVKDYER